MFEKKKISELNINKNENWSLKGHKELLKAIFKIYSQLTFEVKQLSLNHLF